MPESYELMELYKKQSSSLEKHTYFLMTSAGAGIGFAFHKTENEYLSWWLLPIALATLCWAFSFYLGCQTLRQVQKATHLNYQEGLLRKLGKNTPIPNSPPMLTTAPINTINMRCDAALEKAEKYDRWQFRFLILGAFFLISWRITGMIKLYALSLQNI